MPKFQVIAGKHHVNVKNKDGSVERVAYGQGCEAGNIVELSVQEAQKYPNKFMPVVEEEPTPTPPKPAAQGQGQAK